MNLIVHCSASRFGNAALIDSWHRANGWAGIGYHGVILNGQLSSKLFNKHFDGVIESGRPFDDDNRIDPWETGAHTIGKNDKIGVCLIGMSGKFTQKQLLSLEEFARWMIEIFGTVTVSQHSDHDRRKPDCAGLTPDYLAKLNFRLQQNTV
jgi:N-acetylmuramoyl-L-alanine amidase